VSRAKAVRKGYGSALGHLSSPLACRGRGRKPDIARLDITALPDVAASLFGLLLNCPIHARDRPLCATSGQSQIE